MDSGVEKAVAAAAINARQPIKLENTMRQERSLKCQLQWLWQVSANAKYPEARKRMEPTRSGSHIRKSCWSHVKSDDIAL